MPKGKAKSKYNFEKDECKYTAPAGWCDLPKYGRCESLIDCGKDGKACEIML
jgi:hypothetical protein